MKQLLCHLLGDYILQSHWMATTKTTQRFACFCHVILYGVPFFVIGASWSALFVIVSTHFLIDCFRLAKYICYAKNFIAPPNTWFDSNCEGSWSKESCSCQFHWANCSATGFPSETPIWLSSWLLIIVDNTLHLIINYLALQFL
jgi:cytochrome c oxidase subunit IV